MNEFVKAARDLRERSKTGKQFPPERTLLEIEFYGPRKEVNITDIRHELPLRQSWPLSHPRVQKAIELFKKANNIP